MRVNSTDLQNAFGKYLALLEKEDIIILKNGKAVARMSRYAEPDFAILHEEAKDCKTTRKITYAEYQALVESSDQRFELIDGEVYLLASPSYAHQVVVNEIAWRFHNYFKGKPCQSLTAPLDVRLFGFATKFEEDSNVVQPDVVVICDKDKIEGGTYCGVPTLIVEVLSPATRSKDLSAKLQLYMKSGVAEYWIADPEERRVLYYAFTPEREIGKFTVCHEGDTVASAVFAGLALPVQDIFAEI